MFGKDSSRDATSGGRLVLSPLVRLYGHVVERLRAFAAAALSPVWLAPVGIVLVCLLVFRNVLNNAYALDDYYRVVDNPGIQQFWPPWRHFLDPHTSSTLDRIVQYRPLLPLTLSIDVALGGNTVYAHHLGNLILQIVASLLAYVLALELLRHWSHVQLSDRQRVAAAGFAALLFAIHPVSGFVVNYISARDLLLMQVFFLATLLAYAHMRRKGENAWRWLLVLALLSLSLLAKTNLVVAPLLFIAFDLLLARDPLRDARVWQRAAAAGLVIIAFFVVTQLALGFSDLRQIVVDGGSPLTYAMTQARLHIFHYLPHFWWPFSIRVLPFVEAAQLDDWVVWLSVGLVVLSLMLAWWLGRTRFRGKLSRPGRAPLLAFCIVVYWILMIPESSALPLHQIAADYRPYPSSVFLFLAACLAVVQYGNLRFASYGLAGFALYASATSAALNRNWRSGEALWSHSVKYGADAVAHMNLAMSIPDQTDARVRMHLETALRMNPNFVLAHINLCLHQLRHGETEAGLRRCEHAIRLAPDWSQSYQWLATAYRTAGRYVEAAHTSAQAADMEPENLEYHYQAALDAQRIGDWRGSLEHAHQIRARAVSYKELGFVRGYALQMLHREEEALVEYQRLLQEKPDHVQVNFNTGYALMMLGRCSEATRYFETAVKLRPAYEEARYYLDSCRPPAPTRNATRAADRARQRAVPAKAARPVRSPREQRGPS